MKYVREYVHAYLSDTLSEARGHIQEYADSFSHTMQAALATRQQGQPMLVLHATVYLRRMYGVCMVNVWQALMLLHECSP